IAALAGAGIGRYHFAFTIAPENWQYIVQSVVGYQISPGRSLWLYSPILLLAVVGALRLLKAGHWPLVIGPSLLILLFSVSYGATQTANWWGGIGWGPRYLVPLIPVLMLWIFPALEWLAEGSRRLGWTLGVVLLGCLGAGVQILGMIVPIAAYY